MDNEEYYTREKGYSFFVLEEDGKTLRETDVHEWRKWGHRTSNGGWADEVNSWFVSTWFFGEKHNDHLSLWMTSVYPKGCPSPHACVMDLNGGGSRTQGRCEEDRGRGVSQGREGRQVLQ